MLRSAYPVSIIVRLASGVTGSFFFQPLKFHLEPAYLLEKFSFLRLSFPLLPDRGAAKHGRAFFKQFLLPQADLIGMHASFASYLIDDSPEKRGQPPDFMRM